MKAKEYLENHWIKNEVWTHLEWPTHQARLRKCAELMEGDMFADVGCGMGHSTEIMSRFHPGDWTGIEFFPEIIGKARELFPTTRFIALDHVYELTGLLFDGVVCSEVIEHVEYPIELVKCLWSMTNKVLVVTTPNRKVNDPGHLRVFDEKMISEVFTDIPYTVEREDRFFYIVARKQNG